MPILHVQYNLETQTPDGHKTQTAPSVVLIQNGPRVQVTVGLGYELAEQLVQQGQSVPKPVSGVALIDTGASTTCIDIDVAMQMNLPVIDVVKMVSASHQATEQNVCPALIEIMGVPIKINVPRAVGANLSSQGIISLIGRYFLQHCTFFYNGVTGEITLAI